jgi:hypothetical protein
MNEVFLACFKIQFKYQNPSYLKGFMHCMLRLKQYTIASYFAIFDDLGNHLKPLQLTKL